jgi:hypothetical protein
MTALAARTHPAASFEGSQRQRLAGNVSQRNLCQWPRPLIPRFEDADVRDVGDGIGSRRLGLRGPTDRAPRAAPRTSFSPTGGGLAGATALHEKQ